MKRLVFLLVGIVALGLGIFFIANGNSMAKKCTAEIYATVVNVVKEEETDSDGFTSYSYYPVIEYTANGQTISLKDNHSGSTPTTYNIGDKIEIMYNPDNVQEYVFKGDNSYMMGGIVFICLGVLFIFVVIRQILFGR